MSIHDEKNDDEYDAIPGRGHPEKLIGGRASSPARLHYMEDIAAPGPKSILDQVIAREQAERKRAEKAEYYAADSDRGAAGHETRGRDAAEPPLDVELGKYDSRGGRSAEDDFQLPGKLEHRLRKANGGKQKLTAEERRKQHLNMPDGNHHSR